MRLKTRKTISIITAFIMAVTVFGCTSFVFADNEDDAQVSDQVQAAEQDGDVVESQDLDGNEGEPQADEPLTADPQPIDVPGSRKAVGAYRAVNLSWAAVEPKNEGTVSYEIYDSNEESAQPIKTVNELEYAVTDLSPRAGEYTYYIKAIEKYEGGEVKSALGAFSTVKTKDFSEQRLTGLVSDPGYKAVILEFNKVDGATGYKIYRREGGERGNIDEGKDSAGHNLKTFRSKKTKIYPNLVKPKDYVLVKTLAQPKASEVADVKAEGQENEIIEAASLEEYAEKAAAAGKIEYRDGGLKVINHDYAYFYQYMVVPYYEDEEGTLYCKAQKGNELITDETIKNSKVKTSYGTDLSYNVVKNNTVLPMYVLYRVKVNKPYYATASMRDLKHRGRFSKGHLFIGFSRTLGRDQFYEKGRVSNPTTTYWFAQKNTKVIQGYYLNNGSKKTDLTRKDWETGYSPKTVLDYVNKSGLSSGNKYLIWVSKYAQHVYIFEGSKGNWKLLNDGKTKDWKTPCWSNLCGSGSVALQSRNGNYKVFGKQYKVNRKKFDYFYVSKLHSTVRLHTLLFKNGAKPTSTKYKNKVLGNPISNGCVRLKPWTAKYIYENIVKVKATNALVY